MNTPNISLIIVSMLIGTGMVLGIIKLILFKKIVDKAVVLDTMTTAISAIIILIAIFTKNKFFLDIAIIYSVLSFASIIIIARYMEKGI